jgi:L-amino acid N-acyltransferase YncA
LEVGTAQPNAAGNPLAGVSPDLIFMKQFPIFRMVAPAAVGDLFSLGHIMLESICIRLATEDDAVVILGIYRPYVETTAISFETVPPTAEEFSLRIRRALATWQWLVAKNMGNASALRMALRTASVRPIDGQLKSRRTSIPATVVKVLVAHCIPHCSSIWRRKGYCNAYAGITLPNQPSVALHRAVGFEPIGIIRAVGRKFGKWQDVA